jgi:hypothetical protein
VIFVIVASGRTARGRRQHLAPAGGRDAVVGSPTSARATYGSCSRPSPRPVPPTSRSRRNGIRRRRSGSRRRRGGRLPDVDERSGPSRAELHVAGDGCGAGSSPRAGQWRRDGVGSRRLTLRASTVIARIGAAPAGRQQSGGQAKRTGWRATHGHLPGRRGDALGPVLEANVMLSRGQRSRRPVALLAMLTIAGLGSVVASPGSS